MVAYNLSAFAGAGAQFFDDNGNPLVGGKLYTYVAGSTTPKATYTTGTGAFANSNPIILDAAGRTSNEIWLEVGTQYKFILKTSTDILIGTYDTIPSINDPFSVNSLLSNVTGTNAIAATATPTLTAYAAGQTYSFIAANSNTAAATLSIDGLTAKSITKNGTAALSAGDIQAGKLTWVEYDGATFQLINNNVYGGSIENGTIVSLSAPVTVAQGGTGAATLSANSVLLGNGTAALQTVAPSTANNVLTSVGGTWASQSIGVAPEGAYKNLKVQVTADTTIAVTADRLVVGTATSIWRTISTINVTISTAASGANGLDTGAMANSTWYAVWVIYNPTTDTIAGLISTSSTTPTLPSGYTYRARVGWVRYATAALARTLQYGNRVQYVVTTGSQTPNLPIMASGSAGSTTVPTWVAVAWANYAPSTISVLLAVAGSANIAGQVNVAPNNSYGGNASTSNPPMYQTNGSNYAYAPTISCDMTPESSNVYWASNAAQGFLLCRGWIDNL